ncbi:MAG: acyl-CoA dehydrogenase family protein [Rubrivivax sp.]
MSSSADLEQLQMLRDSAAETVRRRADTRALRQRRGTLPGHDPAWPAQLAELGWTGLLVRERQGGLGLGLAEMAAVLQELGKGLMAEPLLPLALATRALHHADRWAGADARMAAVAAGTAWPALAWQEGLGGIDPFAVATRAEPDGAGLRLHGRKRFVAGAASATGFVVSAQRQGGPLLCWVDAGAAGLTLTHEWRADGTPGGVLQLDGVPVAAADVVAHDLAPLQRALDDGCVLAAAEMLGVVEATLQMTLAYLRTRVQFGQPIGSFQALQHKCTDLYVQQELLRAVLADALQVLDDGRDAAAGARLASRCKARAADVGLRVTREAIQLHGAIGFTDEHDVGLYLKRALVLSAWLGNASAHRARFAALQEDTVAL